MTPGQAGNWSAPCKTGDCRAQATVEPHVEGSASEGQVVTSSADPKGMQLEVDGGNLLLPQSMESAPCFQGMLFVVH